MNLRVIKKDIDFVINELISDALMSLHFGKNVKQDSIEEIINDAVELREDLFKRINHPDKKNIKAHYNAVIEDLYEKSDELFERLSKR